MNRTNGYLCGEREIIERQIGIFVERERTRKREI